MEADKKRNQREYYTEGTAARKLMTVPDYEREQQQSPRVITRQEKAPSLKNGIDFFSMSLLIVALAITLYMCYNYLKVQGNIVQLRKDVASAEQDLNAKKAANAALEESLTEQTDWDKIYQIAIGKLHMVYPNKNEVISYRGTEEGYVIQYKDIPD